MSRTPQEVGPSAVERLLRDLGPRLRRGVAAPAEPLPRFATGIAELDELLGGGFPRGRLSEIAGPASSGRTSLALALLAGATRAGETAALVDVAHAFDPGSAEAAGVRLERVLWVRPPGPGEALRCTERLAAVRGFALIVLDLLAPDPRIPPASWPRLARAAAAAGAALVVLSARRAAGTAAELALEMRPGRSRFGGTPALLEELVIEADLVRHRAAPAPRTASVRLRSSSLAA